MTNPHPSAPIIIAGGSGFLGTSLALHLAASHTPVVILSRTTPSVAGPWQHALWDARTIGNWHYELNGAAGLVNLIGLSVDCIKTPDHPFSSAKRGKKPSMRTHFPRNAK
jgi:NAD dependent epimerase/dehydratase family enzyme